MRIVFVNLQSNAKMVKILEKYIFKISVAKKHRYILDELLEREIPVCNYVTKRGHYTNAFENAVFMLSYPLRLLEAKAILKKDHVPTQKIKTLYSLKKIQPDDIVLIYWFKNELQDMEKVNAFKAVCCLHASCGSEFAERIKKIQVQCFYNEADLRKNGQMFRRYYEGLEQPFVVIPFVAEKRFQSKKPFVERMNKALAVGTITYRPDAEFVAVYGGSCLQPIRKMIRDAAGQMDSYYDCVSSDYGEGHKEKEICKNDNLIVKMYKVFWNKNHIGQQKSYFSFDMVEKFNQYKMFICGEEILGVPGIGFVEGMACGCAYIGCRDYDYAVYGMEEGVHYIGYNGTLDDLKEKIAYYQQHEDELERIAKAGYEFARENFTSEAVTTKLLKMLRLEQSKYLSEQRREL